MNELLEVIAAQQDEIDALKASMATLEASVVAILTGMDQRIDAVEKSVSRLQEKKRVTGTRFVFNESVEDAYRDPQGGDHA